MALRQADIDAALAAHTLPIEEHVERLRGIWRNWEDQVFHHLEYRVRADVRWATGDEDLAHACALAAIAAAARLPLYEGDPMPTVQEENEKLGVVYRDEPAAGSAPTATADAEEDRSPSVPTMMESR